MSQLLPGAQVKEKAVRHSCLWWIGRKLSAGTWSIAVEGSQGVGRGLASIPTVLRSPLSGTV